MPDQDCDCMKKVPEMIKGKIAEMHSKTKGFKIVESGFEHHSYYPKVRLYVNYISKFIFEKKDGTPSKPANEHLAIYFSFCPFCGKKYDTDKESSKSES